MTFGEKLSKGPQKDEDCAAFAQLIMYESQI